MQYDEAEELRKNWCGKPCKHERVEREYHLASHTGDYVCTECGQEFTSRQEAEQARQQMYGLTPDTNKSAVRPEIPEV